MVDTLTHIVIDRVTGINWQTDWTRLNGQCNQTEIAKDEKEIKKLARFTFLRFLPTLAAHLQAPHTHYAKPSLQNSCKLP